MRQFILLLFLSFISLIPSAVQAEDSISCGQKHHWEVLLDHIHPSFDAVTGKGKCCPEGFHFDGTGCAVTPNCDPGCKYQDGKCHAEKQPFCPDGSHLRDNNCFANKLPKCTSPSTLEGDVCVLGQLECGEGFQYDNATGKCISTKPPQCFFPDTFYNGKCVARTEPRCQGEMEFEDGHCVFNKAPVCDEGQYNAELSVCDSGTPRCPEDSIVQGSTCMSKNPPKCPIDDEYDPIMKKCTSNELWCDDGWTLDKYTHQCRHKKEPFCRGNTVASFDRIHGTTRCCPADMYWDGKSCVKSAPATGCDYGFNQQGDKCLSPAESEPECDDGSWLKGDACVSISGPRCEFGYDSRNGICIRRENPNCFSKTTVKCGSGSVLRDNVCVLLDASPKCPHGFVFDSKRCISDKPPTCDGNSVFDGEDCVTRKTPSCKNRPGTTFINGKCVKDHPSSCQAAGAMPDGLGRCVMRPICEEGVFLNGGCFVKAPSCDRGTSYDPKTHSCTCAQVVSCDEGYILNNGKCEIPIVPCDGDSIMKGNKCCKKPECGLGQSWSDQLEKCLTVPKCESPYIRQGAECIHRMVPICSPGYKFDMDSGFCVKVKDAACALGSLNHKTGLCEDDGNCKDTAELVDGCCTEKNERLECFDVTLRDCDVPGTYESRLKRLSSALGRSGLTGLPLSISSPYQFELAGWTHQEEAKPEVLKEIRSGEVKFEEAKSEEVESKEVESEEVELEEVEFEKDLSEEVESEENEFEEVE
ncbi:hypothetical protein N7490_007302 [Penicillium lividum]|nr:hypothetical protein N7490_007302 [Penicillium lividum]